MTTSSDFCFGILVGFVAAGVLGFVLQRILFLYKRVRAADQPQKVFQETAQTPSQVVNSSLRAGCMLFLLTVVVLGVCYFSYVAVQ